MAKIDIISGFLGAGKTTLIKKLLNEQLHSEKVVLIENEFGEIGIDGGFLKDANIVVNEINAGCICCSLQGDFKEAIHQVIDTYNPDRIIIEPSGVGKLSDVFKAVQDVDASDINALCTVVDAKKCKIYARNFKEFFADQIASAKCIIVSKTDNISNDKLQETYNIIKEINKDANIITTPWDKLTGKDILDVMEQNTNILDSLCECVGHHEHECDCGCHHEHKHHHDHECDCGCHHEHKHHHDHECDCAGHHEHEHHHDHGCDCVGHHEHEHHHDHHADEVFTSLGYETINKYTKDELTNILGQLPENILRAKGIVPSTEGWLHFDFVSGDYEVREGCAAYTGLITVIGCKIDEAAIKELFKL